MSLENRLKCFKTYDVRGRLGEEINDEVAYRIGRAATQTLGAKMVALGFDARETSPALAASVSKGICDAGADVLDIGFAGTEEIYMAVSEFDADAGVEITASHNPIDYNGMKIVKQGSQPLNAKEFADIEKLAVENNFVESKRLGLIKENKVRARQIYIEKILSFIDIKKLKKFKIVINSGNGAAGIVIDALSEKFSEKGILTDFVLVNHDPDPSFPNGIPNPLLEENRHSTTSAIIEENADFGVAFDGDFDRCFLFDHLGNFIPGEYVVGLLAEVFLKKNRNATIIHDPRVVWNTMDIINEYSGHAVSSKTGHAFVKKAMRQSAAVYGGEMSAHHYFRDFFYCDSGMIPWLIIWELLSQTEFSLADLVAERKRLFPSSGELNFEVLDVGRCMRRIKKLYSGSNYLLDELDGISVSSDDWRFNLRKSNTEPLVRLNLETRGDSRLLKEKIEELTKIIVKN